MEKKEEGLPSRVDFLQWPGHLFVGGGLSNGGDVNLVVSTVTLQFLCRGHRSIGHHRSMVFCDYGSTAWKGLNAGAKTISATAVDPKLFGKILKERKEYTQKHPCKPICRKMPNHIWL